MFGSEILTLEETSKPDKYASVYMDIFNKGDIAVTKDGIFFNLIHDLLNSLLIMVTSSITQAAPVFWKLHRKSSKFQNNYRQRLEIQCWQLICSFTFKMLLKTIYVLQWDSECLLKNTARMKSRIIKAL